MISYCILKNLNHDAHVALGNGETNRAISYINRSLRNDPNQPEMVNMRYQLLGERSIYSESGDVLTNIFDRMIRNSLDSSDEDESLPHSDPLSFVLPAPETAPVGGGTQGCKAQHNRLP